jgi:hypothetical protein
MAHRLELIAKTINALTWRETEELSHDLRQMATGRVEPGDFDTAEERDWMELLQDWAQYQLEDKGA